MGFFDFLHKVHINQPRKKIQFSFGYVHADIDPDAELGPLVKRDYTIIKYRVPDLKVYGEVVVADSTEREMPLLWSDAPERYGVDAIVNEDVNLAEKGYVRIYRKKGGFGKLPDINDAEAVINEFALEEDVSVLPLKHRMSFLLRPQTGEVYREYYGDRYDEVVSGWSVSHSYLEYENLGNERYILSDWIPGYYDAGWKYVLRLHEILSN